MAAEMKPKQICVAQDETEHERSCLVAIEPVSNYILLEKYAGDRQAETWNQEMSKAVAGKPIEIVQSTSDEGRGIISHVKNRLGAHHAPDVFHVNKALRVQFKELETIAEEAGLRDSSRQRIEKATGTGIEDLYYGYPRDHEPSPPEWTAAREAILDQCVEAGKLVLIIDYTAKPEQIADAYQRALAHGYVEYVTDHSLERLRSNKGFEPNKLPEEYDFSALEESQ